MKMPFFKLVTCLSLFYIISTFNSKAQQCSCFNNGICSTFKQYSSCECPQGFIGDKCQIKAYKINQNTIDIEISQNYTYFYFQPEQINYYQLNLKMCLPQFSPQLTSLIFLQVERSTGKIKQQPSIYQTSPLHFFNKQNLCKSFSTHFIPIRQKLNQKFQKIIFGIALKDNSAITNHWLSIFEKDSQLKDQKQKNEVNIFNDIPKTQKMSISCETNLYLTQNHWGTVVIILASLTLILASAIFVYSIKSKFSYSLSSQQILRAYNINPEQFHQRELQAQKNSLSHFQMIMPIQEYKQLKNKSKKAKKRHPKNYLKRRIYMHCEGQKEQKQISQQNFHEKATKKEVQNIEQQNHSIQTICTICLLNFQANDQIRKTPCQHIYHSECIDNWCQATLNCPMCRQDLRLPSQYSRRLYMQLLRAHLHNDAA